MLLYCTWTFTYGMFLFVRIFLVPASAVIVFLMAFVRINSAL
jgi:hypothetical protein